ncbi:MAG TPA: endo-1,4-beta-xylanase [Candidatus Saccharimonadales bacterium]|nr:endo-1,4-beta-xylanase [Candidatus Saccharimonadales bacterium]
MKFVILKPIMRQKKNVIGLSLLISVAMIILVFWLFIREGDEIHTLPSPPLKTLAARHSIELGNFAISTYLNNPRYSNILTSQFNLALIDNTPNWYFTDGGLRPGPNTYNFKTMDQIVSFAESHHMRIQAHHLVWGEEKWLPDWLKNGHYTPAQLLSIMHSDISTVVGNYKGRIQEWSVVNEAFTRQQHIYGLHDWWADNIGSPNYIDDAFIWAHQADPAAVLILNDFDNEHFNPVSDAMYNYIKAAKARGVPIDGIGMQMHIDGTHPPDVNEVIQNMQRFGELGVQVYITEFDVNMSAVPAPDNVRDNIEAGIYYNMMRACIEAGDCHSFSELGITDRETWYNYMGPTTADARPLMFDYNFRPKPAYYAFRNALIQK